MTHVGRLLILGLVGALLFLGTAHAGSPLEKLSLFKRLEADPNKTYPLDDSRGPWLILAATFYGEDAKEQANALVLELRREFKLPAYRHAMTWDFSDNVQGRGVDAYGRPKVMKHVNYEKREEIAVLIGDFATLDDPQGQTTLERIRYMKPQCLDPEYIAQSGQKNSRAFAGWRYAVDHVFSSDSEKKQRGPMAKAFLVTNPLIPQEYFKPKGVDPFVERLNQPLEHSLLTCPGRYTVKVATFNGASVVLPKDVEQIERGEKKLSNRLEKAASQAHLMTAALRAKGWEAYEFHDESSSVVTIGSFGSLGVPRGDGSIEIDPQIRTIIDGFGAVVSYENGVAKAHPRDIVTIPFDVDPVPMEVPKRSVAAAYQRKY